MRNIRKNIQLIIFGILLSVILLEIGLRVREFVITSIQEYNNLNSLGKKDAFRILCLGDSVTAGKLRDISYPEQLEEILNKKNVGVNFTVINGGELGTTLRRVNFKLQDNLDKYNPDMVILMQDHWYDSYLSRKDKQRQKLSGDSYIDNTFFSKQQITVLKINNFLESFRIYRLGRFIYIYISNNLEEYKNTISSQKLEEELKKLIKEDHKNVYGHCLLGTQYFILKKYDEAKAVFLNLEQLNKISDNPVVCFGLGLMYSHGQKDAKAENIFKHIVELNNQDLEGLNRKYRAYLKEGDVRNAEVFFSAMRQKKKKNYLVFEELLPLYLRQGKEGQAEEIVRQMIDINLEGLQIYQKLKEVYQIENRPSDVEEMVKNIKQLNYQNYKLYGQLSKIYLDHPDQYRDSIEQVLLEMDKIDPKKEYIFVSDELEASGEYSTFDKDIKKIYQDIRNTIAQRKIKFVVVQYPLKSINMLKEQFDYQKDIVFVEVKEKFEGAFKEAQYTDLFYDRVGNVYGHGTKEGNRLIAENIAEVILKEYFKQLVS